MGLIKFINKLFTRNIYGIMGWDDIAMLGGSALSGMISGLFGQSEEEKQKQQLLDMLTKEKTDVTDEYKTSVADLNRMTEMSKKQQRGITSSINTSKGIYDPNAIYSAEENIYNAQERGLSTLDANKTKQLKDINDKMMQANMIQVESPFEAGLGGAIGGLSSIGLPLMNALKKPSGGTTEKTTTDDTTGKIPPVVDNNTIYNPNRLSTPDNLGIDINKQNDMFNSILNPQKEKPGGGGMAGGNDLINVTGNQRDELPFSYKLQKPPGWNILKQYNSYDKMFKENYDDNLNDLRLDGMYPYQTGSLLRLK